MKTRHAATIILEPDVHARIDMQRGGGNCGFGRVALPAGNTAPQRKVTAVKQPASASNGKMRAPTLQGSRRELGKLFARPPRRHPRGHREGKPRLSDCGTPQPIENLPLCCPRYTRNRQFRAAEQRAEHGKNRICPDQRRPTPSSQLSPTPPSREHSAAAGT